MKKWITPFKKQEKAPLEGDVNLALREMAGWPLQSHREAGSRHRHRTVTIHRDSLGRVIGSIEQLDEDEYQEYSDTWGK